MSSRSASAVADRLPDFTKDYTPQAMAVFARYVADKSISIAKVCKAEGVSRPSIKKFIIRDGWVAYRQKTFHSMLSKPLVDQWDSEAKQIHEARRLRARAAAQARKLHDVTDALLNSIWDDEAQRFRDVIRSYDKAGNPVYGPPPASEVKAVLQALRDSKAGGDVMLGQDKRDKLEERAAGAQSMTLRLDAGMLQAKARVISSPNGNPAELTDSQSGT